MNRKYIRKDWLRSAILDAGGFGKLAEACQVTPGHLYNLANGLRPLTLMSVARLRIELPAVSGETWLSAIDQDAAAVMRATAP